MGVAGPFCQQHSKINGNLHLLYLSSRKDQLNFSVHILGPSVLVSGFKGFGFWE